MTLTYSRFEVRYRERAKLSLTHVWGWAVDRKELTRLIKGLEANPSLELVDTVDRWTMRAQRETAVFHPATARPGLLL